MSRFGYRITTEQGMEVVELKSDTTKLKIAPGIGNTLFSLQRHGRELMYFPWALDEYRHSDKLGGNPFLHPWANRLEGDHITVDGQQHIFPAELRHLIHRDGNGLPLHGLLLKSDRWKTIELETVEDGITHRAQLDFKEPDWLRIFPFPHQLEMTTCLREYAVFFEVEVYNSGDKAMPLSFGFHPYFLIDPGKTQDLKLLVPMKQVLVTNSLQLPTGELQPKESLWNFEDDEISLGDIRFDHGFCGSEEGYFHQLRQDERKLDVDLFDDYHFMQLYAPNQPDQPYVCIEPMVAPANALNTGHCQMLEPGRSRTESFFISFYHEQFPDVEA